MKYFILILLLIGLISLRAGTSTTDNLLVTGTITGSGASLTSLPAANLTGSIADVRLSANVPLLNAVNTWSGNSNLFNSPVTIGTGVLSVVISNSAASAASGSGTLSIKGTNGTGCISLGSYGVIGDGTQFIQFVGDGTITINPSSGAGLAVFANSGITLKRSVTVPSITITNTLGIISTVTAAGTTGAQTINRSAGRVNFAAAAQTLVVTDSQVTTTSLIFLTVSTDDTTAKSAVVSAQSAGSFTIKLNAAATSETAVNFFITN